MPKLALTDAALQRLKKPPEGQVEYFDRGYPGLALRISYGGSRTFGYYYRYAGKLRRMTLGVYPSMTLANARDAWRKAREEVAAKRDPARARANETGATDFSGVFEEWLRRDQSENRSLPRIKRFIEQDVLPAWGARQIGEIGRRDVLDVIDAVADRGAIVRARRLQAHLHRLFVWAVGRGIVESNPLANLPKRGSETARKRVLTNDELTQVWRAAETVGGPFGSALHLLILTGARRAEIGKLRWSEIVDDAIHLPAERTKNSEPHIIPLSTAAKAVLNSVPRLSGSDFVFSFDGKKPIAAWSRAKDRIDELAPLPAWVIHDIRRSVATGLQKLKVPLTVTEAVLGHVAGSRAGIVAVYQKHDYLEEKLAALEAWGAHVTALVEGRAPGVVLPMRGKR